MHTYNELINYVANLWTDPKAQRTTTAIDYLQKKQQILTLTHTNTDPKRGAVRTDYAIFL